MALACGLCPSGQVWERCATSNVKTFNLLAKVLTLNRFHPFFTVDLGLVRQLKQQFERQESQ
jgi:hypothetical protein